MTEAEKEEQKKAELAKLNASIPDKIKEAIKSFHTKFFGQPPAPAPTPAPAPPPLSLEKVMKTKDGKTLSVAGEPATGIAVMDTSSGSPVALADGTYELEDGSVMVIAGGVISTYTPAAPPMDMGAKFAAEFASQKAEFASFHTQFAAIKAEQLELKKTIADLTEINKTLIEFAHSVTETPVKEEGKKVEVKFEKELTEAEYAKLSNREKTIYNRIWK